MNQEADYNFEKDFVLLLKLICQTLENFKKELSNTRSTIDWKINAYGLGIKLMKHLATLFYLSKGSRLKEFSEFKGLENFVDHSSINVIARSAFETYLTFYGLFVEKNLTDEEREFFVSLWGFRGLLERAKTPSSSKASEEMAKEIKEKIKEWRKRIKNHPVYKKLERDDRDKAVSGEWRLNKGWNILAKEAGFSENFFNAMYGKYSDSAHSGSWITQETFRTFKSGEEERKIEIILGSTVTIMAKFFESYWGLYPKSKPENLTQDESIAILVGKGIGENLYKTV